MNIQITIEKWQKRVAEWEASGQTSVSEWCREQNLCYKSFITWRKRLKESTAVKKIPLKQAFVELADNPAEHPVVKTSRRSSTLIFCKDFDEAMLLRCLQILENA